MKRKILLFLLSVFISCSNYNYFIKTVPVPTKPLFKVAVINENFDSYWVSQYTFRALITELMDEKIAVIERTQLQKLLDEKELEQAGISEKSDDQKTFIYTFLDKHEIKKLGQLWGVDHIITIFIVPHGRELHMGTVRLINVNSGKIITSTTFELQRAQYAQKVLKKIANSIVNSLKNQDTIIDSKVMYRYEKEN